MKGLLLKAAKRYKQLMSLNIRIATRTSALALWQAEEVKRQLLALESSLNISLLPIKSDGDIEQTKGFEHFGYKGVFTKRIEAALLDGRADIAVHSMKDVHSELPDSLLIAAMLPREDVRDAFISSKYDTLESMPEGALIGTASIRRGAVVKHLRPNLEVVPFRGNVPTRLEKLKNGEVDATFLAVAGLSRLGLADEITMIMPTEQMLPAVAQGAIGIEARCDDNEILGLLAQMNHVPTHQCVSAERAMLAAIDGDCHTPLGGLAQLDDGCLTLRGQWISPDGKHIIHAEETGLASQAIAIGTRAGEQIKQQMPEQ